MVELNSQGNFLLTREDVVNAWPYIDAENGRVAAVATTLEAVVPASPATLVVSFPGICIGGLLQCPVGTANALEVSLDGGTAFFTIAIGAEREIRGNFASFVLRGDGGISAYKFMGGVVPGT